MNDEVIGLPCFVIVNELKAVVRGSVRPDLAVLDDRIDGFEIMSDHDTILMASPAGFEPATYFLGGNCSSTELRRQYFGFPKV